MRGADVNAAPNLWAAILPSAIIASAIALAGSLAHFLYFAEAVGHRPLILSGFTISACGLFAIGLTFVLPDVDVITRRRVLIAFVGMTTFSNCGCIITLAHVIANELPAQEFRSVSVSMHWLTFFLSTFVHDLIQPYWINVTELNLAGKVSRSGGSSRSAVGVDH